MNEVITKEDLIKTIAYDQEVPIARVREIYECLEDIIFESLDSVSEDKDVIIKLFTGLVLEGKYTVKKSKKNNLTGKVIVIPGKIRPKARFSRTYCEVLNKPRKNRVRLIKD